MYHIFFTEKLTIFLCVYLLIPLFSNVSRSKNASLKGLIQENEFYGKHQVGDHSSQQHLNKAQVLRKLFARYHKKEGKVEGDMETKKSMIEDLETKMSITRAKLNNKHNKLYSLKVDLEKERSSVTLASNFNFS